jgi:hypothetical protein
MAEKSAAKADYTVNASLAKETAPVFKTIQGAEKKASLDDPSAKELPEYTSLLHTERTIK